MSEKGGTWADEESRTERIDWRARSNGEAQTDKSIKQEGIPGQVVTWDVFRQQLCMHEELESPALGERPDQVKTEAGQRGAHHPRMGG